MQCSIFQPPRVNFTLLTYLLESMQAKWFVLVIRELYCGRWNCEKGAERANNVRVIAETFLCALWSGPAIAASEIEKRKIDRPPYQTYFWFLTILQYKKSKYVSLLFGLSWSSMFWVAIIGDFDMPWFLINLVGFWAPFRFGYLHSSDWAGWRLTVPDLWVECFKMPIALCKQDQGLRLTVRLV